MAVSPDVWASYFKFAFVRNPWERFVSYCAFIHRKEQLFQRDPRATMYAVLEGPEHRGRVWLRPQSEFLLDEENIPMVDFIGRHQSLQADYVTVCSRIGIPATQLGLANASDHGPWKDYYDDELRHRVAVLYKRDIENFDFHFD